jgi:rhamnulokinase
MCAERKVALNSIGIDTWGVDFGLLDSDNRILSNPVHYRDARTNSIHDYSDPVMLRQKIFSSTGCEPWAISSLFQLLAMQRDDSSILKTADSFLNMPDLFNFFLTGIKASERSAASTSNLLGIDGHWCREVLQAFTLPDLFQPLVDSGTVLGPLSPGVTAQTGLGQVPVVATCGHDTSAVVAAIPAEGSDWAFLSSGTWSILGVLCPEPIVSPESFENGFSNEMTLGGWFLCRNMTGLWLIQELCRKWNTPEDPWDYARMALEAAQAGTASMFDAGDDTLLAPEDMEEALAELLGRHGQALPGSRKTLIRTVLESLALEVAFRLHMMSEFRGRPIKKLFVVGGGTANRLLCTFTANACGVPVYAGVSECTALGNALVQATALGILSGPDQIREIMRSSFDLTVYEPQDTGQWKEKVQSYKNMKSRNDTQG